jgi:hypothetical protein
MPDKDLAARTGRTVAAIRFRRKQILGRPPCNPVWKPWTAKEKELLGKMTDGEVALRTGHPVRSVKATRCKLGVTCFDPRNRPWLPNEDALLGQVADEEIARRTGHTFAAVRTRRIARGLRDPSAQRRWTPNEILLLGTAGDEDIAAQVNRTLSSVRSKRKDLRIPAF